MPQVVNGDREGPVQRTLPWHWLFVGAGLLAGAACAEQDSAPAASAWSGDMVAWAGESADGGRLRPGLALTVTPPLSFMAQPGSVDIGLKWRQPLSHQKSVDITAWRRLSPPPDALSLVQQQSTVYGARVEMKLTSPSLKRFMVDKFIGMQLDSGARIGIRRSNGNPTIYYRNQF
jgi:hypothetical protein